MRKLISLCILASLFGWFAHAQQNAITGRTYSGYQLTGTTGSIGGSLLTLGGSSSGTATVTGATTGMVCTAQPSDGTNLIALGAIPTCTVTASNTVTVNIVALVSLTPAAKTYNVRVLP